MKSVRNIRDKISCLRSDFSGNVRSQVKDLYHHTVWFGLGGFRGIDLYLVDLRFDVRSRVFIATEDNKYGKHS